MAIGMKHDELELTFLEMFRAAASEGAGMVQAEADGESPTGRMAEYLDEIQAMAQTEHGQQWPFVLITAFEALWRTIEANNARIARDVVGA